eukprot:scaffold18685_cov84-Isochrysis_galbana.AAC.1
MARGKKGVAILPSHTNGQKCAAAGRQVFGGSVARGLLSTANPAATPPSSTPRSLVRTRKPA